MKKSYFLFLIIFVILFNSFIPIEADELEINNVTSTEFNNDTYLQHYFYHLDENYLPNITNTLCALQSFVNLSVYYKYSYDSNFFDNIINSMQTVTSNENELWAYSTSSGVKNYSELFDINVDDLFSDNSELSIAAVHNYYINLIDVDNYNVIRDLYLQSNSIISENMFQTGYFPSDIPSLVSLFFNNQNSICNVESNKYSYYHVGLGMNNEYNPLNNYRSNVISIINSGYPVIAIFGASSSISHACICYDYDALNDKLYAHADYYDVSNNYCLDTHYDTTNLGNIIGYFYVEILDNSLIGSPYQKFDNYENIVNIQKNNLVHNHDYIYFHNISNNHLSECGCGYQYYHTPIFTTDTYKHYCTLCGYEGDHTGSFYYLNRFNCYGTCNVCNGSFSIPHAWQYYTTYSICSRCHYRSNMENPIVAIIKKEEDE